MTTLLMTQTVACLLSEGELALFLMSTSLVTFPVACLVSEGELALFLMWAVLLTQAVAPLVSACELACFLICTLLVTLWPVLLQEVSWLCFYEGGRFRSRGNSAAWGGGRCPKPSLLIPSVTGLTVCGVSSSWKASYWASLKNSSSHNNLYITWRRMQGPRSRHHTLLYPLSSSLFLAPPP